MVPAPTDFDYLIVGAGPTGGSLACFLSRYGTFLDRDAWRGHSQHSDPTDSWEGFRGLIISAAPLTAHTPRAHVINQPTMESLRDFDRDLENEFRRVGYYGDEKAHTRFCQTMSGREYGRVYSWGSGPERVGDFLLKSPCEHLELPQTQVEPILLRYATQKGFPCRFSTKFISFTQTEDKTGVITTVEDTMFHQTYKIRSKYLFGADGAKSPIAQQLQLPMQVRPSQGTALNVLVRADMSKLMETRLGLLHYVIRSDVEKPDWAAWSIVRMVKKWSEWLFILMYKPGVSSEIMPTREDVQKEVAKIIDEPSIKAETLRIDKWVINETVAQKYSDGRIFCLGDAVHRHPPMNGLGSNTCIQDAANLAWKIAMVEKGIAGPSLLDTYSVERQPVGETVVTRANDSLREYHPIFDALGLLAPDLEHRKEQYGVLDENSERGRVRRRLLISGLDGKCHEFLALGSDMNQRYKSSAVCFEGVGQEPPLPENPSLYHQPHTYPGCRLPHAWLNTAVPTAQISTLDLAGKGRFTLFIGIDGDKWRKAAAAVSQELGLEIATFAIGMSMDYEAIYNRWYHVCEIQEDGCVLVRPDSYVAWRSQSLLDDCQAELMKVLRQVLCLEQNVLSVRDK